MITPNSYSNRCGRHARLRVSAIATATLLAFALSEASPAKPLSLGEATALAIANHPSLAVFDADRRAAEARVLSALQAPNPELEVEVEDVLGDGGFEEFDSAIYNVGVSQLIELGGKRRLRGEAAESARVAEDFRYEAAKREIIRETAIRFVAVLAAQSAVSNAERNREIATEAFETIRKLREGGRGSRIDEVQSRIGVKEAQVEVDRTMQSLEIARRRLGAMWARPEPDFTRVAGHLSAPTGSVPEFETLGPAVEDHPAIASARASVTASEDGLLLEQRKRIPDMNLGVSYRRDDAVNDNAVVLGVSLPLPLRNRNEGGIAEAEAAVARSEARVEQTRNELALELSDAWTRLAAAHETHRLLRAELIPAAVEQFEAVRDALELGRKSYLDLLESRRALNQARNRAIEVLGDYHSARAEIEALTGRPL